MSPGLNNIQNIYAKWIVNPAWVIVFISLSLGLQYYTPFPYDADTAYHFAVAGLIREQGILRSFPWTPFSWLADHYADKDLLFHFLIVPFTGMSWVLGAKFVGAILGTLLLSTIYMILSKEKIPCPGCWTLLGLFSSGYFVMRFALVRPHLVAIPLLLLVAWAAARRRWMILGLGCVLFPLAYIGWHSALILVVFVEASYFFSGRRPDWRSPAVTMVGLGAGLLLHPNFPRNLELFWIQNFTVLFQAAWMKKQGFSLGEELQPFTLKQFCYFGLWPTLLSLAAIIRAWYRRRQDPVPLAFGFAAVAFGIMTIGSQRFIEYLAPFSAVAAALAFGKTFPRVAPVLAGASLAFTLILGNEPIRLLHARTEDFSPFLVKALRRLVPPGAQVFTSHWGTTGEMMLALPNRKFMVALDPVFFFMKDPALYRAWFELVHWPPERPSVVIRSVFKAQFVLCETYFPETIVFFKHLQRDPGLRLLWIDDYWGLFVVLSSTKP